MAIASVSLHQALFPHLSLNYRFRSRPNFSSSLRSASAIRATSAALAPETDLSTQTCRNPDVELFACPVCYEPLIRKGPPGLNLPAIYRSGFKCKTCNKSYSSKDRYLDLTVTSGLKEYTEVKPTGTELFRSPLVSFLYERGWRQNFNRSGFPGPDEEFKMAQEYFKPAEGGLLVDVSCGSGLFSRKFAKSETYSGVIALDFSENMLRQCYDFIKKDDTISTTNLALVRADVSRLPFSSGSVDAVHAGAALHCWPSPSNAIAEISRVLRSGGMFVGTTFLRYTSSTPLIVRPLRQGDKVRRRNDWMRWIIPPTFQFSNRQATRASKPDMLATGFQGLNLEEKVAYNNSSPRGEADFKCGELNRPADLHSNEEAGESSVPSIKKLK